MSHTTRTGDRATFAVPAGIVHAGLAMVAAFLLVWSTYHPGDSTAVERGESLGLTLAVMIGSSVGLVSWMFVDPETFRWRQSAFWLDVIPVLLAVWVVLSAWINAGLFSGWSPPLGGDLRASTNEAWWWIAAAAWWVMLRRGATCASFRFALTGMLVGLGTLLAVHTLHQEFVSFPETFAAYEADPDGQLAQLGLDAPPGSAARMIFENRLRDGGPTATFALANSLAGPLAMLASACLAILASMISSRLQRRATGDQARIHSGGLAVVASAAFLLLFALSVSGSRSGVLAVAIMATVWLTQTFARKWLDARGRFVLMFSGAAILLLGIAVVAVDRDSWSQAPATLQLRIQYWNATLAMVADHPWFGVGPGNFQLVYQAYRDPSAHELIAEPHHFFFETLSASGWIGAFFLIAMLIVAVRVFRSGLKPIEIQSSDATDESKWIIGATGAGGLFGLMWVWYDGIRRDFPPDFDAHQWAVPVAVAMVGGWSVWVKANRQDIDFRRVGAMAAGTGLLHLCFSGGWTIPGVALVLSSFAAMAVPTADDSQTDTDLGANRGLRSQPWVVAAVMVSLVWWMFAFSFRPVAQTDQAMKQAERSLSRNRSEAARNVLQSAMALDPLAADPAIWLAVIENRDRLRRPVEPLPEKSLEIFSQAVDRIGNDPAKLKAIGELHLHRYQVSGLESDLKMASDIFNRLISLSPTHQAYVAQAAEIAREQSRLNGSSHEVADKLARRAEELCEAGGVVTRAINFQMIMPCRKLGRPAIESSVVRPADEVFATW
ncbi:O-antigen ligase family protein [Neorhodopirellula pilleata]|uniref:O-Antigen ligase n=1 Tax=Neorhodopirellula pilleata TaxID=2714738 RepID=A0A5C6A1F0_9BACT|nr:O-antigen ligase family protein [Neorhodopirellula pilleata]TWT93140.1 O-Antigen ligase [Neorhodopirellula pilleata]